MNSEIITWYRLISLKPLSQEEVTKRSDAINEICKQPVRFQLDCTRYFLNKQVQSATFVNDFRQFFTKLDDFFPTSNNDLELRVLAGAVLHEKIKNRGTDWLKSALALKAASFKSKTADILLPEILIFVDQQLKDQSIVERSHKEIATEAEFTSVESLAEPPSMEQLAKSLKLLACTSFKNILNLELQIRGLSEESNIHWWLFRNFSNEFNLSIADLPIHDVPFSVARDLSALTKIQPMPPNYDQFLRKAISQNSNPQENKPLELYISQVTQNGRDHFLHPQQATLWNVCPINLALAKSIESGGVTGWQTAFERVSGLDAKLDATSFEIADQFYIETQLLKMFS